VYVKIIASQRRDVFLRHSVVDNYKLKWLCFDAGVNRQPVQMREQLLGSERILCA